VGAVLMNRAGGKLLYRPGFLRIREVPGRRRQRAFADIDLPTVRSMGILRSAIRA
jgi:hypothetical protein